MMEHYSLFFSDTGEYIGSMTLEEAKNCMVLFNVHKCIVDDLTGEIVMEG